MLPVHQNSHQQLRQRRASKAMHPQACRTRSEAQNYRKGPPSRTCTQAHTATSPDCFLRTYRQVAAGGP